jgi:hypothetical protein
MRLAVLFFLALAVGPALAADSFLVASNNLTALILEGSELHPTLETRRLEASTVRHVRRRVIAQNPQHSTSAEFIEAIARSGTQGKFSGEGIGSALYALYFGEKELGFYGLEAVSEADANRWERVLRKTWSHNERLGRARVHREGLALVVVWTDGASPDVWEAVNSVVENRLMAPP